MARPAYVAFLADVVASRARSPRARATLQQRLRELARELNTRFRAHLAARAAITLGDELQALFTSPAPVWQAAHELRLRVPDVEWVVACGTGGLTTPLRRGATAPELDGPCFHAARAALDAAKADDRVFAFGGFDPCVDGLARYYSALYRGWSAGQRFLATAQRARPDAKLKELARLVRIAPTSISHRRRRMAWHLVVLGDTMFQEVLTR
jgi:SatD family protein